MSDFLNWLIERLHIICSSHKKMHCSLSIFLRGPSLFFFFFIILCMEHTCVWRNDTKLLLLREFGTFYSWFIGVIITPGRLKFKDVSQKTRKKSHFHLNFCIEHENEIYVIASLLHPVINGKLFLYLFLYHVQKTNNRCSRKIKYETG